MKLARKLMILLTLAIVAIMGAHAWHQLQHEVTLFEADIKRSKKFGMGAGAAFQEIWHDEGEIRAQEILRTADAAGPNEVTMRWVWLDGTTGLPPNVSAAEILTSPDGKTTRTEQDADGYWWRYTYVVMSGPGGRKAALELTESLREEMTYLQTNHLAMLLTTLAIVGMCSLVALAIGYWFVGRPVRRLRDQARAVACGDLSGRLALRQHDEIGELAREIDTMCERLNETRERLNAETEARLAAIDQLRHTDRLATVGQLASGIAHELGTPLQVIAARAKMIGERAGDVAQNARVIGEQADRVSVVIRQLLDFSRRQPSRPTPTNLAQLVKRTLSLISPVAHKAGVSVTYEAAETPMVVRVDQNQVQQALMNVLVNGIQAMGRDGRLRVEVGPVTVSPGPHGSAPGEYFRVCIRDDGPGIKAEHLPRIFEPFFTTKDVGEGTGLGLSVAHGIVTEHGGWIEVESAPPEGASFSVFLRPAGGLPADTAEVAS